LGEAYKRHYQKLTQPKQCGLNPESVIKAHLKTTFLLPVLLAGLGLMLASRAPAQTCTNLHSFGGSGDGFMPTAGLFLSGNTLYGTTIYGGAFGSGVVFAIRTDGTGYTILHCFSGQYSAPGGPPYDGARPNGSVILSGNTLYGTTTLGGTPIPPYQADGTVFAVNTDGTSLVADTTLHPFIGSDGAEPQAALILSGNTLYGTAYAAGTNNSGTVFAMPTDGSSFTVIYNFSAQSLTNSDGANPLGGLVLSGNTLYGTADSGGTNGQGTVFRVNTDGSSFTNLHTFGSPGDGRLSRGGLVLSGNTLYGTTAAGGSFGWGAVFAVNTDGSGYTNLHNFAGNDGSGPSGSFVLSGKTLYGSAGGGSFGWGTVFAINTDGTGFTNIYNFPAGTNGMGPNGGLVISGNTLYGTAGAGGAGTGEDSGTVFSLTVPITLFYQNIGSATVLSWNDPSFILQAAPAVTGTYTNIPGATSPYTNTITGPQQFFRLLVSQ
jgi:uncharacterized repeat protein (TIGR03803 family)